MECLSPIYFTLNLGSATVSLNFSAPQPLPPHFAGEEQLCLGLGFGQAMEELFVPST